MGWMRRTRLGGDGCLRNVLHNEVASKLMLRRMRIAQQAVPTRTTRPRYNRLAPDAAVNAVLAALVAGGSPCFGRQRNCARGARATLKAFSKCSDRSVRLVAVLNAGLTDSAARLWQAAHGVRTNFARNMSAGQCLREFARFQLTKCGIAARTQYQTVRFRPRRAMWRCRHWEMG